MSVPDVASAGALLVIARSAAWTVVVAVAVLLRRLGSEVVEVTVAVLEIVVPSGVLGLTWTTMVNVAVAPLARDAVVQLTVPVEPTAGVVQVQPAGCVSDWKVVSAGRGSFIVTLAAAFRSEERRVGKECRSRPWRTGSDKYVLVIDRSASARTVVVAVAGLLRGLGSEVVEVTVAVLEIVVPSGVLGLTWTTMVNVAVAPLARDGVGQHTVSWRASSSVVYASDPGCVSDWKVVSAGRGSFIVTLAAAF